MQFHCSIHPPENPREIFDAVAVANEAGFDRVWIPDQTFHCDPFVVLAEAGRISDIPVGLSLTNPFSRHPVQIARSIATLRHVTPREDWAFVIGASNPRTVLRPLGIPMRNSAANTGEAVRLIRALLRGERVTSSDPRLSFTADRIRLEIDEVDDVAVFIGTRGPQTLREAGRVADGTVVESMFTPDAIAWANEQIEQGRKSAEGEPRAGTYVAWQITEVVEPGKDLPDFARKSAMMLMSTTHRKVLEMMGFPEELIDEVKSDGGPSSVPEWALHRFAAYGTPDELQELVNAARLAGADAWSCTFTGSADSTMASMRRFADGVIAPSRAAWSSVSSHTTERNVSSA